MDALALVILMCTPFFTINAIETMSGGRSMEVTTGETTAANWDSLNKALDHYLGKGSYGDPVLNSGMLIYTKTNCESVYVRYDPVSNTGWYYISDRSYEFNVS